MKVSSVASHSQQESPSHLVIGEGESLPDWYMLSGAWAWAWASVE